MLQRYIEHIVGRRHLQGQGQIEDVHQPHQVVVGYMTPVFAQVGDDTVRAGLGRGTRRTHRIGMTAATRVPDCRNVIDIDPKT
jgi:hypothetical protein